MPTYNHDMMHCSQERCPKKDKCYRYWLYQQPVDELVSVYRPEKVDENCEFYLDIKDW